MAFTKEGIRELHGAMHGSLDVVLDHAGGLPMEALRKEIAGFGYGSVVKQLAHILSTESGWVSRLQSESARLLAAESFASLEDLRSAKKTVMGSTLGYLDSLTDPQLNTEIAQPAEWVGPLRTPAFILLHIVTHAFHHKGQIVAMLRLLGHPAPDTDMQRE
jgi:uncharacterized damage-inducible protein DinB